MVIKMTGKLPSRLFLIQIHKSQTWKTEKKHRLCQSITICFTVKSQSPGSCVCTFLWGFCSKALEILRVTINHNRIIIPLSH